MPVNTPNTMADDSLVPVETVFYFSKIKPIIALVNLVVWIIIVVIDTLKKSNYLLGFVFTAIPLGLLIWVVKRYNKAPQIIFNDRGIATAAAGFYPWQEIGNELVTYNTDSKITKVYLEYDCPNGHEEFCINDLNIKGERLMYLLSVYRTRSGKKYKYDN